MLATCLHMMKGTPYIYQGEELGMTNTPWNSIDECRDIQAIRAYRQYAVDNHIVPEGLMMRCIAEMGRDNARTPMQWDAGEGAGFTTGTPWIKLNPNYKEINAEAALADPDSVFWYYHKLIRLRHENPIIVYGRFIPLLEDSESIYAFRRELDGRTLTVACNWTEEPVPCTLFDDGAGEELISNYAEHKDGMLQPYEARAVLR